MPTYGPPFVYSYGLAFNTDLPVGSTLLATVPSTETWIINDISWFQPATGIGGPDATIALSLAAALNVSGFNFPGGTNSNLVVDAGRFIVVPASLEIWVVSNSVAGATVWVSGRALTNP